MNKFVFYSFAWVFVFVIAGAATAHTQTVEITYKQRLSNNFSADITFSDHNGFSDPSADEVLADSYIYFVISTNPRSQRDHFRQADVDDDLINIQLIQENERIPYSGRLKPLNVCERGRFTRVLMTFDKDNVSLYKPFAFANDLDTTSAIRINEIYFTHHESYREIYEKAMNLQEEGAYLDAFKQLMIIVSDAESKPEISHYSFFEDASQTQIQSVIRSYAEKQQQSYDSISQQFATSLNKNILLRADSLQMVLEQEMEKFTTYFEFGFPNSVSVQERSKETLSSIVSQRAENQNMFRQSHFDFFKNGQYVNNIQFTFYVDLIVRLLSQLDHYKVISDLDTINTQGLDQMPVLKQRLVQTDWRDDFMLKVSLINENIMERGVVFDDEIVQRFSMMTGYQPQPYYEIIAAFNAKSKDISEFYRLLNNALRLCSDEMLVRNIERWILCYDFTTKNISETVINNINNGVDLVKQERWPEVEQAFATITMQADNLATPWFYFALSDLYQENEFSARAKLRNALNRYPQYVTPRLLLFERMYAGSLYEDLLNEVSESLETTDIFLIRYWKAKALLALGKSEEAIQQIEGHCHQLNPYDVNSWFLLGDAYWESGNRSKAAEAYAHTQTLNARDYADEYESRMRLLYQTPDDEEED